MNRDHYKASKALKLHQIINLPHSKKTTSLSSPNVLPMLNLTKESVYSRLEARLHAGTGLCCLSLLGGHIC